MRLRPVYLALLLVSLWIGFGAQFAEAQPAVFPAADRIVAIGDLHGDLHITRHVLRMARITNGLDQWAAGKTVVVQMGDVLDRGDEEQELLEFLARLQKEAEAAGGALHLLLGNHELMNARQDFRYVTEGGFADFRHLRPRRSSPGQAAGGATRPRRRLPPRRALRHAAGPAERGHHRRG